MDIRILKKDEILDALHLTWEVFAKSLAPTYTTEGVEEFQRFIKFENVRTLFERGELVLFGCFQEGSLVGVSAVSNRGHIRLLFVRESHQRCGIAKGLIDYMKGYAARVLRMSVLSVNAEPSASGFYEKQGFCRTGIEQVVQGISFLPMECLLRLEKRQEETVSKDARRNKHILIGVIAGCVVVVLGIFTLVGILMISKGPISERRNPDSQYGEPFDDLDPFQDQEPASEESGIDSIPAYIAEDAGYAVSEQEYTKQEQKQNHYIDFQVEYPELTGLTSPNAKEINEKIRNCALQTVNDVYLSPSQEQKEKTLGEQQVAFVSYVDYKITYQSKQFISIVFNDEFHISPKEDGVMLRTMNINLETGQVYDVKDIVELKEDFMDQWLISMKGEAPGIPMLDKVPLTTFQKVLEGDKSEAEFANGFFVDREGLEIGLSTIGAYGENSSDTFSGWITAPFTFEEIADYRTDSDFWKMVLKP